MIRVRDLLETSFRELEIIVFQEMAEAYLEALKKALEELDRLLCDERDSKRYELKDMQTREIETLLEP